MDEGSPSKVARKLLTYLLLNKDRLPFEYIKIYCKYKHRDQLINLFKGNVDVLTYRDLNKISKDDLVHIPVLPTILPNEKFALYFVSYFIKKCKIVVQYHGDVKKELKSSYKDVKSLLHLFTYLFLKPLLNSFNLVITHSYYMEKVLKEYGVINIAVIPNAIDEYWFQPVSIDVSKDAIASNNHDVNFFYHGRISWEKGIDLLIESFSLFDNGHNSSKLYIAGEGPQKPELIQLCTKLNVSHRVIFLNNISPEMIKIYLNSADIAIYPSRFDNFPLAVLEAFACAECPVFFSKNIGIYDFAIKSGIELGYFDANVESIKMLMDKKSSYNKKRVELQKKFACNYLWDSVINEYIATYGNIISSSG
jgi:glycosyltransferase involved in cell wall biosynthesis